MYDGNIDFTLFRMKNIAAIRMMSM